MNVCRMTKEERQLVIEYIKENDLGGLVISEYTINAHYDTLNFKLYAFKHAWRKLIDKFIFWK